MLQPDPHAVDPMGDEDEALPILEFLQLLWFRRRLILVITVLVGAIGYVQVNQMCNIYSATSSILIGVQQGQVTDRNSYPYSYWNRPQSEEEIQELTALEHPFDTVAKMLLNLKSCQCHLKPELRTIHGLSGPECISWITDRKKQKQNREKIHGNT